MKKFIHVFDEAIKEDMIKQGYVLVNNSIPYIFRNKDSGVIKFDNKKMMYSDVLHF